jgi:hypothetical protein
MCLNHFLKISDDNDIIFPSNPSFLKSKLPELKNPEAISDFKAFHIIIISLSQPHLYKNVSCSIIVFFIYLILFFNLFKIFKASSGVKLFKSIFFNSFSTSLSFSL